jgi:hypothetical protein
VTALKALFNESCVIANSVVRPSIVPLSASEQQSGWFSAPSVPQKSGRAPLLPIDLRSGKVSVYNPNSDCASR